MPTIDKRIVEMQFNNKQFEQGVAESLKSLARLNDALELDQHLDSIERLKNTMDHLDFNQLNSAAQHINDSFTVVGKVINDTKQRIADFIENGLGKLQKAITDYAPAALGLNDLGGGFMKGEGFNKYAKKTKAVQTIMSATGKSVEEVNAVLQDLMDYTDMTSYDFTEMVASIGKFTSVGQDLKKSEKAMEGIANWAAISGADKNAANHVMYNLSQAMGAGVVKMMDWRSVMNMNMATKEFKEEVINAAIAAGTLQKKSDGVGKIMKQTKKATKTTAAEFKEIEVNYQNFDQALSEGFFTSDVLMSVLEKYADTSTDLGAKAYEAAKVALTFSDAVDAVKDALSSGWSRTYEALFGNVEEAGKTWTGLCDAIIEFVQIFSDYRNNILESWHEMGGFNDMLEAASNLWQTFMNIVDKVGESIHKVFPMLESSSVTKMLVDATKSLKDLTAGWLELSGGKRDTEEETEEIEKQTAATKKNTQANKENADSLLTVERSIEQGLKRGARGSQVKEMQETLLKAGMHLDKYGADGIFGPETQAALKNLQKKLGVEQTGVWDKTTNDAAKKAGYLKKTLSNTAKIVSMDISKIQDGLKKGMRGDKVKEMQKQLMAAGYKLDKYGADGIFGSETQAALKKLQRDLGVKQTGVWDKATQNAIKNAKKMKKAQQDAIKAQKAAADNKKAVEETKKEAKETNDIFSRLQNIVTGFLSAVKIVGGAIAGVGYFVKKLIGLAGLLVDPIVSILSAVGLMVTSFEEMMAKDGTLSLLFDTIDQIFAPLEKGIKSFADAISKFFGKNKDIKTFADLWAAIKKEVSENKVWNGIVTAFDKIGTTAGELITIVRNLGEGFGYMVGAKTIETFNWIVENLPGAILVISNTLADFVDSVVNSEIVKTIIGDIASAFSKAWASMEKVEEGIKNFFKRNKNIKNFGDLWKALNKELSKHKGWQAMSKVLTKVGGLFTKVRTKFKAFYEIAKKNIGTGLKNAFSWITTDFPIIISKIVDFGEKMVNAVKNSETLKKAWEGISGFFKTTFGVIKGLADDLWGSIKKFFFDGEDSVGGPFEKLKAKIDEVKDKISKFGETVSGKLKEIYNNSEFIRNLYDNYLKPFWDRITTFAKLLKEGIVGFATTDTSDIEGFGNKLKKRLKAFAPLVDFITGIGEDVREAIKSLIGSFSFKDLLMTFVDGFNIFGSAKAEGGSGSIYYTEEETSSGGVFDRIINNVKELINKASGIDIVGFVKEKLESVGLDGDQLVKFIMSSLGYIALFKVARGISKIGKGFAMGGKGLLEAGVGFKDLGTTIGGAFKEFSTTVGGSVKSFLLGKDGANSLGDMVVNFTKEMAKAKNQRPKDSLGTTFLKLSTSLLIVAGAIALISTIKPEELEKNIGIFIGVVAGLGTMVGLLGLEGDNIEKLGHGILAMSGALALLVAAIEGMALVVQFNDPDILSKSLEIIRNMLLLLGGIEFAIAKAGGIGGDKNVINVKLPSILSMCAGVGILVLAVAKMVKIIESTSADTFDKAFESIKSLLTRLGEIEIALALLGRNKGNGIINVKLPGILSMCAGIYVLALAVSKMVKIIEGTNVETFDKAFDSIKSLLTRLGEIEVVLALLGRNKGAGVVNVKIGGILSMCAGIMLLTFAVDRVVKGMEASSKYEAAFDLIKSLLTRLGEIEVGIAWASKGQGFKVGGILGMCAGIAVMVYAICKLADVYDTYERVTDGGQKVNRLEQAFDMVKSFMTRLAVMVKMMSGAVVSLSAIPIAGAISAAANLVTFGAIVVGAIAGLAALLGGINDAIKEITDGFDLGEWLGEKMAAFGNGIGRFIGGIIVGIQHPFENGQDVETKTLAQNIEDLGSSLSKALDSFMPLLDKVQGISQTHVTGLTNFAQCLLAMTGADLVDSIAAFIGGKKGEGETGSAFVDFAWQLVKLCEPLVVLGPAANVVENDKLLKLVPVMETLKTIATAVTDIGWEQVKSTVLDTFSEGDGILGMFPQLRSTIIATSRLVDTIQKNSIDTNVLSSMEPIFTSLHNIAQTVTGIQWEQLKTNVFKAFSGDNDLVSFANTLYSAGPDLLKFAYYSAKISNYASGIEGTATALKAIASAAEQVPKTGGLLQDLIGEQDYLGFAASLGALGTGLTSFYRNTKNIPTDYTSTGAAKALEEIIAVADKIPKVDGLTQAIFGQSDPKTFGKSLGALGLGLYSFVSNTKGLTGDELEVSGAVGALTAISDLEKGLEEHGGIINEWFTGEKDLNAFAENVATLGGKLKTFSDNTHDLDPVGMQAAALTLKMLAEAFAEVPDMNGGSWKFDAFNEILNNAYTIDFTDFSDIGNSMLTNIVNGFYKDSTEPLSDPFNKILRSGNATIRSWYDTFKEAGGYLIEGAKIGIEEGESNLTGAIQRVFAAGLKTAAETWDEHSPSKEGEVLGEYFDTGTANGIWSGADSLTNAIKGVFGEGIDVAEDTLKNIKVSSIGEWADLIGISDDEASSILNSISNATDLSVKSIQEYSDILRKSPDEVEKIFSGLFDITKNNSINFDNLQNSSENGIEDFINAITDKRDSFTDSIFSLDDSLTDATKDFGQGMIDNIMNATTELKEVSTEITDNGVKKIKYSDGSIRIEIPEAEVNYSNDPKDVEKARADAEVRMRNAELKYLQEQVDKETDPHTKLNLREQLAVQKLQFGVTDRNEFDKEMLSIMSEYEKSVKATNTKTEEASKTTKEAAKENAKNTKEAADKVVDKAEESTSILDKWLSGSENYKNEQKANFDKVTGKSSKSNIATSTNNKTFKNDKDMQTWVDQIVKENADHYYVDWSDFHNWASRTASKKSGNLEEQHAIKKALMEANNSRLVDADTYKEITDTWVNENIKPGEKYFKSAKSLREYAEKQAKLQSDDADEIEKLKNAYINSHKDNVLNSNEWDMVQFSKYGFNWDKYKNRREANANDRLAPFLDTFDQMVTKAFDQASKMYPDDASARDQYFNKLVEIGQKFIKRPGYDYGSKSFFINEQELQQWANHYAEEAVKKGVINPGQQSQYAEELIKNNMSKVVDAVKKAADDKLVVQPTIRPVIDAENATIKGGNGNVVQKDISGLNQGGQVQSLAQRVFETFNPGVSAAKASEIGIKDVKSNMVTLDENLKTRDEQYYQGLKDLTNTMGVKLTDLANMRVYIDGRTLLGYLTPKLDRSMGNATVLAGRMN